MAAAACFGERQRPFRLIGYHAGCEDITPGVISFALSITARISAMASAGVIGDPPDAA